MHISGETTHNKPKRLPGNILQQLSRVSPYKGPAIVTMEWLLIIMAAWLCNSFFHWSLYILTVIFIGSRQHALLVMMHEAVHYRLLPNRKLNDLIGNIFCAWPIMLNYEVYRKAHFAHHRYLMTDNDPDWNVQKEEAEYRFPKKLTGFLTLFIRDIIGLGAYQQLQTIFLYKNDRTQPAPKQKSRNTKLKAYILPLLYLLALVLLYLIGMLPEFFLYWIVPAFTWLKWSLYLRSVGEHHGLDSNKDASEQHPLSRTTKVGWLSKIFIASHNVSYHAEHHLYPSVPQYNLPQIHKLLMQDDGFRHHNRITHGYFNVMRECS